MVHTIEKVPESISHACFRCNQTKCPMLHPSSGAAVSAVPHVTPQSFPVEKSLTLVAQQKIVLCVQNIGGVFFCLEQSRRLSCRWMLDVVAHISFVAKFQKSLQSGLGVFLQAHCIPYIRFIRMSNLHVPCQLELWLLAIKANAGPVPDALPDVDAIPGEVVDAYLLRLGEPENKCGAPRFSVPPTC